MSEVASVLLVVTVYNGRELVLRCLESVEGLDDDGFDLDVIVLDDKSPDTAWSAELEQECAERKIGYYCTPRNLGIPRNVSLGLRLAVEANYTHVVIANSDVIFASNSIAQLLATVQSDATIGSATAISNNVSIYSIPNADPDRHLGDPNVVNWLGACLAGNYGATAVDIPAGISFAIIVPTAVISKVGVMDPVYGRGYCEETDWTLRSKGAGYRVVLAPGAFVYHEGGGSNREAGVLASGHTTVPANERIIDLRFPLFRSEVAAFIHGGILDELREGSKAAIVRQAAKHWGYYIHVGWLPRPAAPDIVRVLVSPSGLTPRVTAEFKGFSVDVPIEGDIAQSIRRYFDADPTSIDVFSFGPNVQHLRDTFGTGAPAIPSYPERV